ncbi:MAG: hypothetical protein ACTHLJ_08245 [Angustibacter sp.]
MSASEQARTDGPARARLSPELARLVEQLWGEEARGLRVVTDGPPPVGFVPVEQYDVFPDLARAKVLLPTGDRSVARAVLLQYAALRARPARWARRVLAALLAMGLGRLALRQRLVVCAPAHLDEAELGDRVLLRHLRRALGRDDLVAAIGVANPGPNRKPTLQLFGPSGEPVAYVKVGWNDLTRGMVENEATTLDLLADAPVAPAHPRPLLHSRWGELSLLAVSPLPLDVRMQDRSTVPDPSSVRDLLPNRPPARLAETAWWSSVRERLDQLAIDDTVAADERATVAGFAAGLLDRVGVQLCHEAPWHGDWAFWNMAPAGDQLWVWDWEHFAPAVPVGFDECHYVFQERFVTGGLDVAGALAAARQELTRRPVSAALAPDVLVRAYALEMYLRAARMHRLGAGWNPRFHGPLVDWVGGAW